MSSHNNNKLTKLKNLKKFINDNIGLAEQGSPDWLEERKYIIGGSEISSIVKKNPYSTLMGLVAQKVGLSSFNGNTYTRWGNLFENVSELFFKTLFIEDGEQIYTTGSILNKQIPNHRYSPDGLCVMAFLELNSKTNIIERISKTTLLEFKSPYSSIPSAKVPSHYLPQVKAGLCTIDLAEIAIFNNNMYRKCSIKQLNLTMDYDNDYHRDNEKKLKDIEHPIATGLILFSISEENTALFLQRYAELNNKPSIDYDSDEESFLNNDSFVITNKHMEYISNDIHSNDKSSDSDSDLDNYQNFDNGTNIMHKLYKNVAAFQEHSASEILIKQMVDLGTETKELFDQFLTMYKMDNEKSFLDIKCIKPTFNKDLMQSDSKNFIISPALNYIKTDTYMDNTCKKYNIEKIISLFVDRCIKKKSIPVAVLPWKLLRSSNLIVHKDPEYLNNIKSDIDSAIVIIKDINNNSKTMDEKADLFEKHFGNNQITKSHYDNKKDSIEFIKEFL